MRWIVEDRFGRRITEKYLLVTVKVIDMEGFVITSFFTDRIKRGEKIWKRD